MIKTIKTITYTLLLLLTFSGCENKWPKNGDLDGFWQLMSITSDGVTTKSSQQIYWSIRSNLVQMNVAEDYRYFAHFSHLDDDLVLTDFCSEATNDDESTNIDPWIPDSLSYKLNIYGIYPQQDTSHPERVTQTFHIVQLNSDTMILESNGRTLTFRKF